MLQVRVLLTCTSIALAVGCISSGRSSLRGRPGRVSNREPMIYKEYLPRRSELSLSASGAAEGAISRDDARFKDLLENNNIDIVFKDEEGTGADRMMTSRCKDKLDSLAIMVMNQWEGVKLRVIEGWDEDGAHAEDSLHYEGRAVDITTSDRDRLKLSILGRLAYDAGFDYVSYESKSHIHCSVKSDEEANMLGADMSSGCFASGSYVSMADGTQKRIENLRINDKVLSLSTKTGEIIPDTVFAFLDVDHSSRQKFTELSYEGGKLLATENHLLYVANSDEQPFSASVPIFAKNTLVNSFMYMRVNNTLTKRRVLGVKTTEKEGFYAPLTLSGNIIVNRVATSCYASINSHWLAHLALSPLRASHYVINLTTVTTFKRPSQGVHWYAQMLKSFFPFLLS